MFSLHLSPCSNNTNKLSPQEPSLGDAISNVCSNNTNKLSPQESLARCSVTT